MASSVRRDVMVGFEDDLVEIKSRLCGGSSCLEVISIFGMCGIGKTTLARNTYHDSLCVERFYIRAWVTVSRDCDEGNILSYLLASLLPYLEKPTDDHVEVQIHQTLMGRRYLIVLDDMWTTDAWYAVKRLCPDDNNGSRIILTSRISKLATSRFELRMRLMDADESWNLLQIKVFGDGVCPSEVEATGRKISRSCRGLPLAIVVISGLLSAVPATRASWEAIAEDVNEALIANGERYVDNVLSLSYDRLPSHLRSCILYMGLFPEDYEIHTWKLFKLWEAEGFVEPSGSEEQAEKYLEDLVQRSLVSVLTRKANGKIKSVGVHDLVGELCVRKAVNNKFLSHISNVRMSENPWQGIDNQDRVCIAHCSLERLNSFPESTLSTIRTFICFQCKGRSHLFIKNMISLRVLDVVNNTCEGCLVPRGLYKLSELRFLSLDNYLALPSYRIERLQNLHTIIIHQRKAFYAPFKITLPLEIWRMPQLRHLIAFNFGPLPCSKNSELPNLQTLSVVEEFVSPSDFCERVPNLKKLGATYTYTGDHNGCKPYYQLEQLQHLQQLEKFKLDVQQRFRYHNMLNPVFPSSLRKLTLSGWHRPWEDMSIIGSLPNLEVLKLRDFAFCGPNWETNEEGFLQLRFLLIDKSDLQSWKTESEHFPMLRHLFLYRCWHLKEIPEDIGNISALELIQVDESVGDSAKHLMEKQQEDGNYTLKVNTGRYDSLIADIK